MKLEEYEDIINSTDISNRSLQFYLDGMSEESGEIAGVFKRIRRGDFGEDVKREITEIEDNLAKLIKEHPKIKMAIIHEIGDREWYTNRFLKTIDSNMNEVLEENAKKVKRRISDGTIMGDGDER